LISWEEIFKLKGNNLEILHLTNHKHSRRNEQQKQNITKKEDIFAISKYCKKLTELAFFEVNFQDSLLDLCENLKDLKILTFEHCQSHSWLGISLLVHLNRLNLEGSGVNNVEDLKAIVQNCKNLNYLNVSYLPCLNHEILDLICELPHLKTLKLKNDTNISGWNPKKNQIRILY
jgi:hypothetical protein